jgi:hypothetical protein
MDEKTRIVFPGEATEFKSLNCQIYTGDEFVINFENTTLWLTNSHIINLRDIVPFPGKIISDTSRRFRCLARESRRLKFMNEEEERRKAAEQREFKKKQMLELQQKQKDLVQLALKRAQNKKATNTSLIGTPPTERHPIQSPSMTWSLPPPSGGSSWSSATIRPMIPPPIPHMQWAGHPHGIIPMQVLDPWSSAAFQHVSSQANPWVRSTGEPDPKRAKTPPDATIQQPPSSEVTDAMKQRMIRFGTQPRQ